MSHYYLRNCTWEGSCLILGASKIPFSNFHLWNGLLDWKSFAFNVLKVLAPLFSISLYSWKIWSPQLWLSSSRSFQRTVSNHKAPAHRNKPLRKWKGNLQNEKIFPHRILDKGSISKIRKNSCKSITTTMKTEWFKSGQRNWLFLI